MQYGNSDWQKWVLGEEEAVKHIKAAYVFCTSYSGHLKSSIYSDMMREFRHSTRPMYVEFFNVALDSNLYNFNYQVYSNGLSEIILGKAIKELKLPRDEIVVLTKARFSWISSMQFLIFHLAGLCHSCSRIRHQSYFEWNKSR